jgi:hypothetical protein
MKYSIIRQSKKKSLPIEKEKQIIIEKPALYLISSLWELQNLR